MLPRPDRSRTSRPGQDGVARPVPARRQVPAATLPFRVMTSVNVALVWAQPVLIGQFLGGDFTMLAVHSTVGAIVATAGLLLMITSILAWRPGGWPGWVVTVSSALFLASGAQIAAGINRDLVVHIPLGVVLATAGLALAGWAWSPRRRPAAPTAGTATDAGGRPAVPWTAPATPGPPGTPGTAAPAGTPAPAMAAPPAGPHAENAPGAGR